TSATSRGRDERSESPQARREVEPWCRRVGPDAARRSLLMARIAGVNLPLNKRSEIGLTYIYGVGRATSNKILEQVGVSPDTYVRDLTEDEVARLRAAIDDGRAVEGDLRRER